MCRHLGEQRALELKYETLLKRAGRGSKNKIIRLLRLARSTVREQSKGWGGWCAKSAPMPIGKNRTCGPLQIVSRSALVHMAISGTKGTLVLDRWLFESALSHECRFPPFCDGATGARKKLQVVRGLL